MRLQRCPLNVCRISQFYFYWELVYIFMLYIFVLNFVVFGSSVSIFVNSHVFVNEFSINCFVNNMFASIYVYQRLKKP